MVRRLHRAVRRCLEIHPSASEAAPLALHAGHGADWIPADSRQFVGPFGGISVALANQCELMLEYDGDIVTVGQRVRLFDHIQLLTALRNFDVFAVGDGFYFRLPS